MTDLPPGWEWSSLGELIGSGLFSDGDWVETKDQDPEGDVRLLQLADVGEGEFRDRSDRHLTAASTEALRCTYLESGDVLVARMPDPLGRACRVPSLGGPSVTAVDVCILRPTAIGADPAWLMWVINAPQARKQIVAMQSGTTRKRISRKNLATVLFAVPPQAEQERIAVAIEEHLSRLDAADQQLAAAERRTDVMAGASVRALFDDAVWPWTTLGDIAEIKGGVTKDAKRQSDSAHVEVPYLRVANVQRGRLDLDDVATIRVPQRAAESLRLESGDVLLNEGGDRDKLGRGWVWEGQIDDCIHQNHVFRARLTREFDPYFVSTHANTWGRGWFEEHGRQTTNLASINMSTLKQLPVPAPPLAEQQSVVAELQRTLDAQQRLVRSITHARRRASGLRRAILAAAFSGRLVRQDPDDEPASVLLDRIRSERESAARLARTRARR